MATEIEKITINFVKRNARKRGPTSSDAWNDQGEELSNDLNSISSKWNNLILPLLTTVPNGSNDLNAFSTGLSGKTLYVDNKVTGSDNSVYWNASSSRPNNVKEQFDNVYTELSNSIEELQSLVGASIPSAGLIGIKDANDLYEATNVEDALQEVMGQLSSYSAPTSANDFAVSNKITIGTPADAGFIRGTTSILKVTNGGTGGGGLNIPGAAAVNGEALTFTSISANVTLNTGSTTTTSSLSIPAGAMVLDVVGRVTTAITTAANYSVGVSGATTRYLNASTGIASGSTWVGIDTNPRKYTSATAIVLTTNVNPGAGVVRVTVFYYLPTAPTS